jgi:cell wall-associated NlpC family hydrolase
VKILAPLCLLALVLVLVGSALPAAEMQDAHVRARGAALHVAKHRAPVRRRKSPLQAPLGLRAAKLARHWLGVGYRWGGGSPATGFDCSGFTSYVYGRLGVRLPHNAAAQFGTGRPVARSRLRPGDLLFFRGLGHVGMYVGKGRMIHAPQTGDVVRIVRLGTDYHGVLVGARRFTPAYTTHN